MSFSILHHLVPWLAAYRPVPPLGRLLASSTEGPVVETSGGPVSTYVRFVGPYVRRDAISYVKYSDPLGSYLLENSLFREVFPQSFLELHTGGNSLF